MSFHLVMPPDVTPAGGEDAALGLLARAGMVAVRAADLASPCGRGRGTDGRTALTAAGPARNTVRRTLVSEGPPRYQRAVKGSTVDAAKPRIRGLLAEWPEMPTTVIAQRIGWDRSLTALNVRVRELRPLIVPPDPAWRTEYLPGELAQCDPWFPPTDVPLGAGQAWRPPVLVMVAGYSRVMTARMMPSRQSRTCLPGRWALISGLGAVPRSLVWDNESAVGQCRGGKRGEEDRPLRLGAPDSHAHDAADLTHKVQFRNLISRLPPSGIERLVATWQGAVSRAEQRGWRAVRTAPAITGL